ncbi:filamentous hemagglutinin N-terminal domain-containing protein [Pseudomonas sp. ACM7]|uniref:two-partner secretion domain-containing protein n=1 Tax=Pseudomonas sp. ACM7 TaxID=2052956 RepID=UPI001011B709|nr:filamentous hemagglutinin N-terminal domain-containing protein [Pseudomonas sp. ACM7]QAY92217.1 hemagglutinin [Pseudomonas sp. ACM7]
MDVRHYALLAGQPSAAVKNRERFWGMPKRGLAFLLANVMFWQPMWAQAEGIVVATPGTSLGQAGNGVAIVNIATPNGTGLSHNQFHDYNVGTQGVILNNVANQTGATQLGGIIVGNPNLTNRIAAQTILNEVIGGSPSQLRGYTEVAGQSARVIVANPYGISCNGCGFINTPRVTLTTGKPVLDGGGRLDRFQVDQGSIAIEGAGLNATNVDRFEIITRSAKINAEIQANNLTLIAGRNDVNADSLNATARADDGSAKPGLAIDSSALGGMYAGAIKLVGTEAGVGVKLDGKLIASGGDIQLDANGHLSLVDTSATGAVIVKAASLDARGPVYAGSALNVQTKGNLTNQQTLAARDSIMLSAGGQLTNSGVIEAGVNADSSRNANGDVSLTAQNLNNNGKSVVASRNLSVNTAQTLSNQGGTLSAAQTANITAGTLDNRNNGRVLSTGALNITANQAFNASGVINSVGNLTGTFGQMNNSNGEISSTRITRLNAITLNNQSGQVLGDLGLNIDLSGALDNRDGLLGSGKQVELKAASIDNRDAGVIVSDGSLTARISGLLDNQNEGEISAKGAIDVRSGSLDNRGGKVSGKDTLTVSSDSADNRGGVIQADKQLKLQISQLDNRDKGLISGKAGIAYDGTRLDNSAGLLSAIGAVTLNADEVQNAAGRISSQSDLTANIGLLQQQGGALVAQGNLSLTGTTLDNRNGGLVGTTKALTLKVGDIDNRAGELSSGLLLNIKGQRLDNSDGGKVLAATHLEMVVAKLINQNKGQIVAKGATTLTGTTLDNTGGTFDSLNGLVITLDDALLNGQGLISSEGILTINAASLDNSAGSLGSAGALSVTSRGALVNQSGSISTDNTLTLDSASLDNSQKGLISGKDTTRVVTGNVDNSQGGRLISGATLELTAKQVNNATGRIASQQALTASVTGLDQQGGELFSQTSLSLDLNNGQLNNQGGLINAPLLMLKNLKDVNNQHGEISSAQAFTLAAQNLDNSNGKLLSNQGLTLRIAQALNNLKGVISASSLDSHSASLNNSEGLISSHDRLELTTDNTLDNQQGAVIADGELLLTADTLDNLGGDIAGKADATVQVKTLNNQKGKLITTGVLKLTADTLDNRQKGLLGSTKAMTLTVDDLDNRGGEVSTNADLSVTGTKLDNSDGGQIFTGQALTLTVDQLLNRNKGLLSATTALNLQGRLLDNSGGHLLSVQNMHLNLTGAFDNSLGEVGSEGALTVKTTQLTNTEGSLSSAAGLKLTSDGSVSNQGGAVVTDGALTLNSASLDNRQQGNISGKGAVTVTTGAFDNSQGGRLNSASTLNLVAGQVTNRADGRIGSEGALTASVTGLDQQGGKLFSNSSLSLDLNNGQLNNQNGLINAPGTLLLKQLKGVNNTGGEISSTEAFTLTAQSLDNSNGKLLSNQGLTLRIANALDNIKGLIGAASLDAHAASVNNSGGSLTSRGDLELTVDGVLRNDAKGLINAAQLLKIGSAEFNNQSGTVLGVSAVILDAMALNNRDGGLINSQGNLTLIATSLDSSNDGEVSAKGNIDLTLTSLTQNGGRLLGDKAVTVELANGDFDNRNGLLTAKGPLTLKRLRDLNNQNGEISSNLGFDVIARALDNSAGKLISNQLLTVNGTALVNQKGLISGWQGLTVNGDSLDNRDSGTLSSRNGDVAVDLKGALLNSNAGALVGQGSLNVKASTLDNSNKGILSSAAGQTLTLTSLNNNQGGLIDSGAALDITAGALTNAGGTINAQEAINATATGLDNTAGSIAGNGAVTLDLLGALTNTRGKLAGAGPVLIKRVTDLANQNGQLASQSTLTLLTGSLDNSNNGTIAAKDALQITASGAVRNDANGLIYSQNAGLNLQAASLANGKGAIQSQNGLTLDVSGNLDNQSGKVIAENGVVTVKAASIDNRGGVLSSIKGALEARTVGVLRNGYDLNNNRQGGIIQGQGLTLSALAGLDNNGGRISAQATDASITTAAFDNRNGVLYAKGLVGVTGISLDNGNGQIAGNRIDLSLSGALSNRAGIVESDTTLTVKAASVDNQTGRLRSLGTTGKTSFQIGGLLDNRNGVLETANTDLTLAVGSFLNAGGQLNHVGRGRFDISTANVIGAGGGITTGGTLDLNADTWANSSVIQAGRLNVNVNNFSQTASGKLLASDYLQARGGNWTNDGLIASDGVLDMQLGGSYSGNGRMSSIGGLSLTAAQLSLNAASSIAGGGDSTVKVGGQLTNAGRLTSNADLTVEAGSLNNTGTLGSSQALLIKTPNLMNDRGLIFSGQNTALEVGSLTNNYGDFYSLADLTIKGYAGAARANVLENISGVMESVGNMSINATTLNNRGDKFEVTRKLVSGFIAVHCNDCRGDTYSVDYGLREIYEGSVSDQSPGAKLTSGGNFTFNGGDFLNSRSEVVAASNITINANNFTNLGASAGTIERTRIFTAPGITDGTHTRFVLGDLWEYNKRNDNGPLTFHYIDNTGQFRTTNYATEEYTLKGSFEYRSILVDSETGKKLIGYGGARHPDRYEQSEYDPNNLLSIPTRLANYAVVSDVEVSRDGGAVQSAIVQAGGKVSINAAQNLTNSVIHQDYGFSAGVDRRQNTQGGGTGKPLLVHLNSQLPPDLSQQQVNPLTLPGFSLPSGENGLFRLSEQGASSLPAGVGTQHPSNWIVGSENVSTLGHVVAASSGGPRSLLVDSPVAVSSSDRAVDPVRRPPTVAAGVASTLDVSVTSTAPRTGGLGDDMKSSFDNRPVTRVTGLPDVKAPANGHKYLIETNPVLTNLKQFMSSDYLLSNLGYDPDTSAKRLGDGLYEQRLIQQAVVARTGQRYIDGQTTDEGLFKYLMNNAIASKDALNLSMGVSLTSQQVAALTHDIVWLEEHEVNGEKVLVPVLYLAQAEGRLGPTGALIAGKDVTLIAGQNLDNVGTLRATNNLSATAGKDLVNSGLIQAGNRLDVLAGNDVINKSGGILAGRDVSVNAIMGDVLNERTITSQDNKTRFGTQHHDFADSAARIEAANDLNVSAGRDINNIGGVLQSGRDIDLNAGRDLNVSSAQVTNSVFRDSRHNSSDITQLGATVSAGRDLSAQAGRDISVIASQIDAKRDIAMSATDNLIISSAADEEHSLSKSKKLTRQEDHVSQVMSGITAGGDVALGAGQNLAVVSSRITAGDEAYLVAGDSLDILAAQDTDYSLYDKKKKGSFGSKKTKRDEVTDVKNIGSEITSGGNMVLASGGNQHYQAAKLDSGNDLTISSGGAITFEGVKDLHQESHEKSDTSLSWNSMSGKGNTDETLRQSQLVAQGQLVIKAVDGLNIDIKQINQKSVSQTIDAMVQADPQLAWLKEAEKRGDVDWRLIKETHESFKYSNSSLGQGAMLVIIIIVTVLTAGAASAAAGTAAGATAGSGTAMAAAGTASASAVAGGAAVGSTVGAGLGNMMASAVLTSMASTAAVSTINNKGNVGAAFKDVFSSDNLKGYVLAGVTAGIAAQFGFNPTELTFDSADAKAVAIKIAADTVAKTAIMGGSLTNNLVDATVGAGISIGGALAANKIGDVTLFENGKLTKLAMHAALGGLMAEAMGGDFRTGALAAGANEAVVDFLADKLLPVGVDRNSLEYQQGVSKLLAASQLVGVLTAAVTGGDASAAAAVTANATQYNNLDHPSAERLLKELQGCRATQGCTAENIREIVGQYEKLSSQRSMAINACGNRACVEDIQKSAVSLETPVAKDLMDFLRRNISYDMAGLLTGNPGLIAVPSQGVDPWGAMFTSDKQMAFAKYVKEGWLTPDETAGIDQWVKDTSWLDVQAGKQLSLQDRANMMTGLTSAAAMALIGRNPAGAGGVGAKGVSSVADDFFAGTKYTDKVVGQIKIGDLHAFPESVKAFQGSGQVTKITGGDGVVRDMLKIPGEYRGKQGVFEFIKESDGSINHRLFKPSSGQ